MTQALLDIKKWGNSLGVRLPATVARAANLHVDQRMRVMVVNKTIMIHPLEEESLLPLTLEERVSLFDPERHGGEEMKTQRLGAEKW